MSYLKESFAVWPLKLPRIYFPLSFNKQVSHIEEMLFLCMMILGAGKEQSHR